MSYDPFTLPDYEHYEGEDDGQGLVTGITGSQSMEPDRTPEVKQIAAERDMMQKADAQLREELIVGQCAPQRVVEVGVETILRQVYCLANVPSQLCNINYQRSRLVISGSGANIIICDTQPAGPLLIASPPFNSVVIGYAANPFVRTMRTVRDLWVMADASVFISVQEEFFIV